MEKETLDLKRIEEIYSETRAYFEASELEEYTRPKSQSGNAGFCIFYTPVYYRPDVLIIGQNPSRFNPSASDCVSPEDEMMMSGKPPKINSYLEHNHRFASKLRDFFGGFERMDLLENSVGMNIWFAQAVEFRPKDETTRELRCFCEEKTKELIEMISPKIIFAVGFTAFDRLTGKNEKGNTCKNSRGVRLYDESTFLEYPVIGCPQLTGNRNSSSDNSKSRALVANRLSGV